MITGNPQIVATNGTYNIIKRGSSYAVLKDGEPIEKARNWKGKKLLTSFIIKGYKKVDPPKPYDVQNPIMIVATNGDGIIISNGLGYAYLKEPNDKIVWKDKKLLYTALSKGGFRKIEPEEYEGEVNLSKAMNSNLVKKKVPVHQENGKTYMAYRWVDPTTGQVQDNSGKQVKNEDKAYANVRNNNTATSTRDAWMDDVDDDIMNWFSSVGDDDWVDDNWGIDDDILADSVEDVPEHNADNPVEPIEDDFIFSSDGDDFSDKEDSLRDELDNWDFDSDDDNYMTHPEINNDFDNLVSEMKSYTQEALDYCNMDNYPELASSLESLIHLDSSSANLLKIDCDFACSVMNLNDEQKQTTLRSMIYDYSMSKFVSENYPQVLDSAEKHYLTDNFSKCDEVTSSRKQTIHKLNGQTPTKNKWGVVASHPALLKFSLVQNLGKERYEKLKSQLSKGNLTINFPSPNMESIMENGYKSTSFVEAIHRTLPIEKQNDDGVLQKNVDLYLSAIESATFDSDYSPEMASFWDKEDKADGDWVEYLDNKSRIEYQVTGAHPVDMTQRPIYMAFNPSGKVTGAATMFGDGVIRVHDDILPQCTASSEDSFYTQDGTSPFVKDIDHLQDMYISKILKNVGKRTMEPPFSMNGDSKEWTDCSSFVDMDNTSMVPIELHYHGKKLENNKNFIINGRV